MDAVSMNIVQVMHSHTVGGVERHVVDLSEELIARGHRVFLACPNRGWMWDAVQGTAVTPIHLAMDGLFDVTSVGRLARLAHKVKADVIHSHMTRGTFYAVKAGRRARVPIVATCHATHTWKHYAGADRILCVSRAAQQNLLRHEVPSEKTRVVHNGIRIPDKLPDITTVARLRSEWGVPPTGRVVGTLARLIPDKGLDLLLQVAARWKSAHPDVRFILAGSGDEETERILRTMAAEYCLGDTVRFLGMVPNPDEVLAAYDILAAPSRRESFSLTLLEAMVVGTPVVASNVGGTPEMVTNGHTGYLIEPESVDALDAGLARALDDPDRRNIVDEAQRMVRTRFSLDRMVSDIESNYLDLVR